MNDRSRHLAPLIITLVILGVLSVFIWCVAMVYTGIQSGDIQSSSDINLTSGEAITTSPRLAQIVRSVDPEQAMDVATDDDPSIGNPDAKLTIVEFADFGCPFSREASFSIRALALTYADRIEYIYRDFPITDSHPEAQMAAEAGECAREQDEDKFWAYHDTLYQNQDDLARSSLREYARAVGLNVSKFDQCLASGRYRQEVLEDFQDGVEAGVVGTPTFFFNGQRVAGAIPLETLRLIVDAYLD